MNEALQILDVVAWPLCFGIVALKVIPVVARELREARKEERRSR